MHLKLLLMLRPETPDLSTAHLAHKEQAMASLPGQNEVKGTCSGRYDDIRSARDIATYSLHIRRIRNTRLSTAKRRRINDDYTLEMRRKTYIAYRSTSLGGSWLSASLQTTIVPPEMQFVAEITRVRRAERLAGAHVSACKCSQGATNICKHTR
jgi:hypothetical protein